MSVSAVIDGILVEVEDCDGNLCAFLSKGRASSSLAVVQDFGMIDPDESYAVAVSETTLAKIEQWVEQQEGAGV